MHSSFRIKDIYKSINCSKTLKMGMFEQIVAKNGLEWPKFSSFIRSFSTMLKVIVIGM